MVLSCICIMVLWTRFSPKQEDTVGGTGETLTVSIILTCQGVVLLGTCCSVILNFKSITITEVFAIYFTKVIFFGTAYILCYIREEEAFFHPAWFSKQTYPNICMSFMYYSMSVMTLTGQGDIWPATVPVEAMSMVQYILGVSYTIFTISQALDVIARRSRKRRESKDNLWKRTFVHNPFVRRIRQELRKVLFLVVAIAQTIKILYLGYSHTGNILTHSSCTYNEFWFFMTLDVCLLLIVIFTSSKVIQWDHRNRDISMWFLVQCYLSCAIIFAGIYIDIQAVSIGDTSPFDPTNRQVALRERSYSTVVFEFLHFALATQTAVGQSGNLEPRNASAYLLIMIQMGHSFIFHTYIFGLGLLKIRTSRMSSEKKRSQFLHALVRTLSLSTGGSPRLYGSTESLLNSPGTHQGDEVFLQHITNQLQEVSKSRRRFSTDGTYRPCILSEPNTSQANPCTQQSLKACGVIQTDYCRKEEVINSSKMSPPYGERPSD